LDYHKQAILIFRRVGERIAEGRAFNFLGRVYYELEQKEKAFESYQKAWRILREVGDRWYEGGTVNNVGVLYFKQGRYEVALACFLLAKNIFDELQNPLNDETQTWIEQIHKELGEQFTTLLATVEPQAQKIVDQALHDRLQ